MFGFPALLAVALGLDSVLQHSTSFSDAILPSWTFAKARGDGTAFDAIEAGLCLPAGSFWTTRSAGPAFSPRSVKPGSFWRCFMVLVVWLMES